MNNKRTYPECLEEIGLRMAEPFISASTKHKLECLLCNNEFSAEPRSKLVHYKRTGRKGCPECTKQSKNNGEINFPTQMSSRNEELHFMLENEAKMRSVFGNISLNAKSDYECMICNDIFKYTGKYLTARFRKYNSIGCPECSAKRKRIEYLSDVKDKLSDYEIINLDEEAVNLSKENITLRRLECEHVFTTTVHNMLYGGVVCPECDNIRKRNQKGLFNSDGEMVKKQAYSPEHVLKMFKNRLLCEEKPVKFKDINSYEGMDIPMTFICGKCDREWNARPANVLFLNSGCPHCVKSNYSQVSIQWLNSIMERDNIIIQHAENGGEKSFVVNGKRYYVDGYCEENNTIYEFHGSYYHGDPNMFDDNDRPHPFKKDVTAKELYEATIKKEQDLQSLGYNVVSMWESNFQP